MPVVCCRCNASGRCKNCSCRKAGRECLNCLPRQRGHCENSSPLASCAHGPTTTDTSLNEPDYSNPQHSPMNPRGDMNMVDQTMVTSIPETQETRMPSQSETHLDLEQDIEDLPTFTPVPEPDFRWGEVKEGRSFACALNRVYDEIVQWKRNLFKVPSGNAGKAFVRELSRMFNAYAEGSALECVAMKAAMTMPALLLQKPSSRSKAREHILHLERRLKLWSDGKLDDLLHEGRTVQ